MGSADSEQEAEASGFGVLVFSEIYIRIYIYIYTYTYVRANPYISLLGCTYIHVKTHMYFPINMPLHICLFGVMQVGPSAAS